MTLVEARQVAVLLCSSPPCLACHPLPCGPRWLKTTSALQPAVRGEGKRNAFSFILRASVETAHGTSVQIPLLPIPVTTPQGRLGNVVLFWVAVYTAITSLSREDGEVRSGAGVGGATHSPRHKG